MILLFEKKKKLDFAPSNSVVHVIRHDLVDQSDN